MGIPEIPTFVYSLMLWGGVIGFITWATFVYVPPPWNYVAEINLPFCETMKLVYKPGLRFLPRIPPIILVRNKVFMADDAVTLTIGSNDGKPGGSGKVELSDTKAGIIAQIVIRATNALDATYNVDISDVGQNPLGLARYKIAAINKGEGGLRMLLAGKSLEEAMKTIGSNPASGEADDVEKILVKINKTMEHWGVEIPELTIIDFDLDEETTRQRDKIIAAQKQAEARVIEAGGLKQAAITVAEGGRRARQLEGLGQKEQIEGVIAINGGIDPELAMQFHLGEKITEAMKTATLIVTSGTDGGLNIPGAIATAGAILNPKGKQTPPATAPQTNPAGNSGQNNGGNP